jgi:site-specific recombinase XerD
MSKVIHSGLPGSVPKTVEDLVDEFECYLRLQNRSPATVRSYRHDLIAVLGGYKGEIRAITVQILLDLLAVGRAVSPATRARRRASLRSFFDWGVTVGHLETNPADRLPKVKVAEQQPRAIADKDLGKVLAVIRDKRDALLFNLLADTGLRVSEALSIRLSDIRLHANQVTVVGKGNRERTVYMNKCRSLTLLKQFLKANGWLAKDQETIVEDGLLFRPIEAKQRHGLPGQPIHYSVVQKSWKRYCAAAGAGDLTIHQLRHTHATQLINDGVRVEVVQKILGHRNLQTTQRYASVSDETVRKALEGRTRKH